MRPAQLHFLTSKDGFKTLISQIYVQDDKLIGSDVQFGVTRKLERNFSVAIAALFFGSTNVSQTIVRLNDVYRPNR